MHESIIIQRALLTVYDKTHIIPLAEALHLSGVELISTGNTASVLKEHGLPVTTVSEYTGFPEIMNGRVKTLHPKIAGGILGRRDIDGDIMLAHNIPDIDLVVVNLYPFKQVSSDQNATLDDIIENIDIGGPTLIRASAKNYEWCTVLVDPNDYQSFLTVLAQHNGAIPEKTRFHFAIKAFSHTANYEKDIAHFMAKIDQQSIGFSSRNTVVDQESTSQPLGSLNAHSDLLPEKITFNSTLTLQFTLKEKLRYGENPHQTGAFYQDPTPPLDSITCAIQLQGKTLSFNNIADGDTALECVKCFTLPACVIVKHANPCGVAIGDNLLQAYDKAYACDSVSAFGGIIAFNKIVDEKLLQHIFNQQFVELIIAPEFTSNAIQIAQQKQNCRLLQYQPQNHTKATQIMLDLKRVNGGILVQSADTSNIMNIQRVVVTQRHPTPSQMEDLLFSWHVAKYVKSNAVVYANQGQTLGIGAGQMSRIFSAEIGALKAKAANFPLKNGVMASDAFFPFKDMIEKAHTLGIRAIIQPGGSMRDQEIITSANDLGIAMVFTGTRTFRH